MTCMVKSNKNRPPSVEGLAPPYKSEMVQMLEMIPPLIKSFKESKHEVKLSLTGKQLEELGKLTAKWVKEES